MTRLHKAGAECLGTLLLLTAVMGSGVVAQRLTQGQVALAFLINTLVTVAALFVLIEVFRPLSGAHFNPAVSLALCLRGQIAKQELLIYIPAQLLGAVLGTCLVHVMFDLPLVQIATQAPQGSDLLLSGVFLSEMVATAGLLLVVFLSSGHRVASHVAAYIGAASWFTASGAVANPASVLGRLFSDTFAGLAPSAATGYVLAELLGVLLALALFRVLKPK